MCQTRRGSRIGNGKLEEDDALPEFDPRRLALDNSQAVPSAQRPGPRPKGAVQPNLDNRPRRLLICCTLI